jgi:acyl-CoA dehydrogenase
MFECSEKTAELRERLLRFMDDHIYPNEAALLDHEHGPDRWQPAALVETLKEKARQQGLWNLFLPESEHGAGLSNLDYAHLCEIMGRSPFAPEVFNCAAPDTGNMEVLARYGTEEQKSRWLLPLLAGEIRSCFSMTEPAATATTMSSRAANGGPRAPWIRAAASPSSWARPIRPKSATGSSR